MIDLIIKNARIADGTGSPIYPGEIAVDSGKIEAVAADLDSDAHRIIDVGGNIVAPGFIDLHSHSDLTALKDGLQGKIRQGVTTEIVGNCGFSAAPVPREQRELARQVLGPLLGEGQPGSWEDLDSYLQALKASPLLLNIGTLIGHGTLRLAVMGLDSRKAGTEEKKQMAKELEKAFEQGAWGLSTGLIYSPSGYADFDELRELCRVASAAGVPYVSHIRSEANRVVEAVEEALQLGLETGVQIHFSHHQIDGRANWGKARETLALIEEARDKGVGVTLDQYPFQAGSTMLWALLPQWIQDRSREEVLKSLREPAVRSRIKEELEGEGDLLITVTGWENIMLNSLPVSRELEQQSLQEAAEKKGKSCADLFLDLIIENQGSGTVVLFDQSYEDWKTIFADPFCSIATDSILVGDKPHPRSFGSFPRVLGEMVREKGLTTLEQAIYKMTLLPARTFGIPGIGALKTGYRADLVVFDPDRVGFSGTFKNPDCPPEGIELIIIEGKVVCLEGEITDCRVGQVLEKNF